MIAYLGLGSNLGDRNLHLHQAVGLITERIGTVAVVSSVYESEPWGFLSDNAFLNCVVAVETELAPETLLDIILEIEKELGRVGKTTPGQPYQDRIIDIDIILYGDTEYKSERLEIPHPLYKERDFVLIPLKEIAPHLFDIGLI